MNNNNKIMFTYAYICFKVLNDIKNIRLNKYNTVFL